MTYHYIDTSEALTAYCAQAKTQPAIMLDTEFVRTRTYYPQLGLVQLFDGRELALVDPLAVTDLAPLKDLVEDPNVVKVLHACSEDIEALQRGLNAVPAPLFDTQFAAGLLNLGPSLGYAKLVETLLGVELPKGEARTDWLARPLREQQLDYAADDVRYLWDCYQQLAEQLQAQQRFEWVLQEGALWVKKKQANLTPAQAYLGLKNAWLCRGKSLAALQRLAQWRLQTAMEKDLALNFVLRETSMVEMAKRRPLQRQGFFGIEGVLPQQARRYQDSWLAILAQVEELSPEEYPAPVERLVHFPAFKQTSKDFAQGIKKRAAELGIAESLLASKKQTNQLLKWLWFANDDTRAQGLRPDLLQDWRYPLLQGTLTAILGSSLQPPHDP